MHGEVYISDGGLRRGSEERTGADVLAGWLALGQLHGAGYGTSVEPAIAVDAKGFPRILLELGGTVNGFEQRKKACRDMSGLARGGAVTGRSNT
jgi:hypothetical protein